MVPINYLSIGLAVLASLLLGFVWYMPSVLGNTWMRLAGVKPTGKSVALPMLSSIVSAFLLAFALERMQIPFQQTLVIGLFLWLVFTESFILQHFLYEGRSMKLYALYAIHHFLNVVVVATVVSLMR